MLHVGLYKCSRSKYWYVDIPAALSPTGRRLRKSTGTKDKRVADKIRAETENGNFKVLFGMRSIRPYDQFEKDYLKYAEAHFSTGTHELYKEIIPRVLGACSWPPMTDELRDYWQGRLDTIRPITINKERRAVHAALEWGVHEGYLPKNPCAQIPEWSVKDPASVEWFTFGEVASILEKLTPKYHALVHWALATGMRLSECLNLKWDDIGEKVRIVGKGRGGQKKIRHLPMSEAMNDIIEKQREVHSGATGPFPFLKNTVSQSFRRARRAAGIYKGHFHALRDTAAVWMLQSGVSIYHVKNVLGHSSVRVTERYYGHMVIDDLKSALDTLGAASVRISSEKSGDTERGKSRSQGK